MELLIEVSNPGPIGIRLGLMSDSTQVVTRLLRDPV